ncbi:MAG: hypothetical protein KBG15_10470 [Kofleriaceae bacterium]|nr:hypothetical protein [Kofleriaceae bacterium]
MTVRRDIIRRAFGSACPPPRREAALPAAMIPVLIIVLITVLLARPMPVAAYEFSARAYATAQGYQLRSFGSYGRVSLLSRQRFTQSLDLSIWDIPGWQAGRQRRGLADGGVRVSLVGSARVDHDFGTYTAGAMRIGNVRRDALDVVPELANSVIALQLMYGYLHVDGLLNERVAFDAGRLVGNDGFEYFSVDGARVSAALHRYATVRATAGVRVREASPFGMAASELDGNAGADCREYVEGAAPDSGSWQLIAPDRLIVNRRLSSDYEYCPQRSALLPMVDAAVVTTGLGWIAAEAGYRRAWSDSVGLLGDVARLRYPDLGYYPNDNGQAPASGVNQEVGYWHVHGKTKVGAVSLQPYWDARYSLLHARVDRSVLGLRVARQAHAVDLSSQYMNPTFDGDSIFSIFVVEPAVDVRVAYAFEGGRASRTAPQRNGAPRNFASLGFAGTSDDRPPPVRPRSVRLELWGKQFLTAPLAPTASSTSTSSVSSRFAGGGQAWLDQGLTPIWSFRVAGLYDAGYGGRRISTSGELVATPSRGSLVAMRAAVAALASDTLSDTVVRSPLSESLHLRALWRPVDYVGVGAMMEWNHNTVAGNDIRGWLTLSLGYVPEQ